ncbi:hypothetical protein ACFIJ5_14265 [Haloimpatiens sp. FM7330]|uniref:hypothetical protein n=1 Tax=Haloimpatiens sp. FM7330 TaxID=3298610 RepID=UPI0036283437
MKNLKKIIIIVICALIVGGIMYIILPKKGFLGDLVLSKYKGSNFNSIRVNINSETPHKGNGDFTCKNKDKINKFLSYLDKVKVVEYEESFEYSKKRIYIIDINTEDDKEIRTCANLTICEKNLQLINVEDKDGFERTYKVLNNEFDMKYIEGLK